MAPAALAFRIGPADHRQAHIASAIHAIQQLAYTQEAALLGATVFPPLDRTAREIEAGAEVFIGAWADDLLIAALGIEPATQGTVAGIGSLVVAPAWQRRGIARGLLTAAIASLGDTPVSVSTATKNLPALALYRSVGFVEHARRSVGSERIELVTLRREPSEAARRA